MPAAYAEPRMPAFSLERRKTLTLAATVLGSSLAFLDATVVIVALPTIEQELDIGLNGQQWIFLSYSLALASLYLVGGAVGDRYGRRNTFMAGAAAFLAASILAGVAPNAALLIVARALQGIGGAFMTTNSLALLRSVYAEDAGRAIGRWTSLTSVATLAGPLAGGALVEWVTWRWIFFLNLPLGLVCLAVAELGRCDEAKQLRKGALDIPGAALAAVSFGMLTYGLVQGAATSFGEVWWSFLVTAASLTAFAYRETTCAEPMLPPALFRVRNFFVANLATFLIYGALYGVLVFLTIYLQFLGFTPFEAGLLLVPTSAAMIFLAARFGALADRHGPRLYLSGGPALIGIGALLFLGLAERDDLWTWGLVGLACFSIGLAAMVAPITATAMRAAPERYAGIASGVNSTVSRLGSLIAVAVIGLVISLVFEARTEAHGAVPIEKGQTDPALRDASTDGFRAGMGLAALLAFAGAAVAGAGISNREARAEASEPEPAPAES
jgi:EmrB/QacA subfamily drug resistance transporter